MENKKFLISILSVVCILSSVFLLQEIMYLNSKTTCGIFSHEFSGKGINNYNYKFKVDDVIYNGNIEANDVNQTFKELKKDSCVEIEYSVFIPLFNRCVDSRILRYK